MSLRCSYLDLLLDLNVLAVNSYRQVCFVGGYGIRGVGVLLTAIGRVIRGRLVFHLIHNLLELHDLVIVGWRPRSGRFVVESCLWDIVPGAIARNAGERVRQVNPRTDEDGTSRQGDGLVPEGNEQRHDHAAAGRITGEDNRAWVLVLQQVQVGCEAVVKAAGERKLGRQPVPRCKRPGLELPRMALQLVPVLVDTSKEIGTPVYIEHDSVSRVAFPLTLAMVMPHLDPLRLQLLPRHSPLPPLAPANFLDSIRTELVLEQGSSSSKLGIGNRYFGDSDPLGMRNPLAGESLQLLDGVMRCESKKRPYEMKALVIRYVGCRFLSQWLAIQILQSVSQLVPIPPGRRATLSLEPSDG